MRLGAAEWRHCFTNRTSVDEVASFPMQELIDFWPSKPWLVQMRLSISLDWDVEHRNDEMRLSSRKRLGETQTNHLLSLTSANLLSSAVQAF